MKKIHLGEFKPYHSRTHFNCADFGLTKCMDDVLEIRWSDWYIVIKNEYNQLVVSVAHINADDTTTNLMDVEKESFRLNYIWPDVAKIDIHQDWPYEFQISVCGEDRKQDLMLQWGEYNELHLLRSNNSQGGFDDENPIHTFYS